MKLQFVALLLLTLFSTGNEVSTAMYTTYGTVRVEDLLSLYKPTSSCKEIKKYTVHLRQRLV